MSACCVSGCKSRHSPNSKVKFYRIPSGYRPFQANRRRLWLRAIQEVNGGTEELRGNARICGAHFISGEASMDHHSPDFIPSVFTCSEPRPSPRTKTKRCYRHRRRRLRKARLETSGKTTSLTADSSVDLQSSVLMETESELTEEMHTPSDPSVPKEREPLTEEAEATLSPNKTPPSFKATSDIQKLNKMSPVVLLKPVVSPEGGFWCELCNQNVISVTQLVKHKRMHEKEKKSIICEISGKNFRDETDFIEHQHVHTDQPSFSCNMCDRSFATSHNLKRHKLLHVRDGRKCRMCGTLFCRRHNHIVFQAQAKSVPESEEFIIEQQNVDNNFISQNSLLKECPPKPGPSALHTRILSGISLPVLVKTFSEPCPPPPVLRYPKTPSTSSEFKAPLHGYPAAVIQPPPPQNLQLPPSLKIFSPQFLTSALLEVKRNYEYILSKPGKIQKEIVKEEPCELPLISPDEHSNEQVREERTAYDLEIVL